MMKDLKGQHVDLRNKPKLSTPGVFEGEAAFRHHRDAVEYAGLCNHCHGVVSGVLRLVDPALQITVKPIGLLVKLERQCVEIMRERHQCSIVHEGKTNVDEWLERLGRA